MLYASSQSLSIDSNVIDIQRDTNGRPLITNSLQYDFNLSHQGDFTLLTSCHNMRTGVDVMRIELPRESNYSHSFPCLAASTSVDSFVSKMKSIFSKYELDWINSTSEKVEKIKRFYRLWVVTTSPF